MKIAICMLLLCWFPASAQNLLMNEGFEEENICTEYIKNCAPEGWISTSLVANYYFDDAPHAHGGQHFTGLLFRSSPVKPYVYLRSRLLCGLRAGAFYRLRFYVRSEQSFLDSIGFAFFDRDILFDRTRQRNYTPLAVAGTQVSPTRKGQWQLVEFEIQATGTEQFLVLGDFQRNPRTFSGRPDLFDSYYFFLDDISLEPVNSAEKLCDDASRIREEEYAMDVRHGMLDKIMYRNSRKPPVIEPLSKTVLQRIDTLVIPDVLFATASFALTAEASGVLDSFSRRVTGLRLDSMVVEGHTDSIGSVALNERLSINRAGAVAAYLQPSVALPIITRGLASTRPVADNRTPAGRRQNRRVEIYLYIRD